MKNKYLQSECGSPTSKAANERKTGGGRARGAGDARERYEYGFACVIHFQIPIYGLIHFELSPQRMLNAEILPTTKLNGTT